MYILRSATGPVSDIFHLEAADTPAAAAAGAAAAPAPAPAPATPTPTLLRQHRRARFPSRERAVLLDFVPAAMPLARDSSAHAHASGTESSAPSTPIGGGGGSGGGRYRRASSSNSRRLDSFRPVRAASGLQHLLRHGDSGGSGGTRRLGSGGMWAGGAGGGGGGGAPGEGLLGVPAQVVGGESMPFLHLVGTGGGATSEWDALGMGSGGIERSLRQRQQHHPRHGGGGGGINPYLARQASFLCCKFRR